MGIVKIFCDDCNKWHEVEFEFPSELPNMTCPKCKSERVWFGDIVDEDMNEESLTMGRGGRRQK